MPTPIEAAASLAASGETFVFFDGAKAPEGGGFSYLFVRPTRVLTEREGRFSLDGAELADPIEELASWSGEKRVVAGLLGFELGWLLDDIHAQMHQPETARLWVAEFDQWAVYSHAEGRWAKPLGWTPQEIAHSPTTLIEPELSITDEQYRQRVDRARRAIYEGELFEVNYTARFRGGWGASGWELYQRLRDRSTGAYFAFMQNEEFSVASVSPELFIDIVGDRVVARPIKGTAEVLSDEALDRAARERLSGSEKDRAENIMIVDLMRNDLTRFCRPGTVEATEICGLETFAGVHHLVSTVEGRLAEGVSRIAALLSAFPAGSITGAPKVRSIELIAELEEDARGAYTGSMFFDVPGRLASNVLIRTATLRDGVASYGAGGAVVSGSIPEKELEEAYVKARGFLSLTEHQ